MEKLSKEQLEAVVQAGDKILESVNLDRRRALINAARVVGELEQAENCSIFLLTRTRPQFLELEASASESWTPEPGNKLRLAMEGVEKLSLTAHLVQEGTPVIMNHRDLEKCGYGAQEGLVHLYGGCRFSLLAVPLINRKNQVEGLIKCENKQDGASKSGPGVYFTDSDMAMAKLLANKIAAVTQIVFVNEGVDLLDAAAELMSDLQEKRGRDGLLPSVIERAVQLLRADRGDFAWWTAEKGGLVYAAYYGPTDEKKVGRNVQVPEHSFVRAVFENRKEDCRIAHDLWNPKERSEHPYYEISPKTRSELAVRVQLDGNPVGVLNVESFEPDWFDTRDADLLRVVAGHAAVAIEMVQSDGLARRALEFKGQPEEILAPILDGMLESCGFDEGIIYRADRTQRALKVAASKHCDQVNFDAKNFVHSLDGTSFAAWMFNTDFPRQPPYIISDKPASDARVDQLALANWRIEGPLLGFQLTFRNERVGCAVLWTRRRPFPSRIKIARVDEFARLAAIKIAFSKARQEREEHWRLYKDLAENCQLMVFTKRAVPWGKGEQRPEGVAPDSPKVVFDYSNRAFMDYVGATDNARLRGTTDWDWFREHALKYYNDDLRVLRGEILAAFEEDNRRPRDGALRHVRVWKNAIWDLGKKNIIGLQVMFWDRTDLKEQEKVKDSVLEERGTILKDFIHRFPKIVRYVDAFLGLVQNTTNNQGVIDVMRCTRTRIQNFELLQNLLYGQRESSLVEMKPFLSRLVQAVVESFPQQRGGRTIQHDAHEILAVRFPQQVALHCGLIVNELVSNALEHAFNDITDGKIIVGLTRERDMYELTVCDNGSGVGGAWDDDSRRALGVSIVEQLTTRQLGGQVSAGSYEAQQKERPGTRIEIRFPLSVPATPLPSLQAGSIPGARSVVIVEDDGMSALQYESLFRRNGYSVVCTVATKQAAVWAAQNSNPSVIVMDIRLGQDKYGGIDAAREIWKYSKVPIVFLTELSRSEVEAQLEGFPAPSLIKCANLDENLLLQVDLAILHAFKGRKIFVCYSRKDVQYRQELMRHLKSINYFKGDIEDWSDERLEAGKSWLPQIQEAIRESIAAVLLVSADFMRSDFIQKYELPRLLEAAGSGATSLYFVKLFDCPLDLPNGDSLARFQFFGETKDKPIGSYDELRRHERENIWAGIYEGIKRSLQAVGCDPKIALCPSTNKSDPTGCGS
jgi:two-component sensor histidine kinase/GAF domain-containing protein/CheY-like chemotaxis protein